MRVLFITHGAYFTGAPISLLAIMRYIKENTDWDLRILVRKTGPLMHLHEELAPTELFLLPPPEMPNTWSRLKECVKILSRRKPRTALRYWKLGPEVPVKQIQKQHYKYLKKLYHDWNPDFVYSNTAMNGDCIHVLDLDAPVAVHVRELEKTLSQLKGMRLDSFLQRTDCWVAVSEAVKSHLLEAYKLDESKIRIAHAAIEDKPIREKSEIISQATLRDELGITADTMLIGGVGFVGLRKGVDLFVDVAMKVLKENGDRRPLAFVWLGETTEPKTEDMVRARIREHGLQKNIQLIGLKENPYPYMKLFDFLLMTSRDDPFPRVNIECGLFERPIIAFAESGGSAEFVSGDCGILARHLDVDDMAAKTIELIDNDSLRKKLGKNALAKVESRYTIKSVAPLVTTYIEEILQERLNRPDPEKIEAPDQEQPKSQIVPTTEIPAIEKPTPPQMPAEPLVSVIMTSYNYEKYVGEAIESVFGQTYKKLELIVVDDGSTDNTREVIESCSKDASVPIQTIFQENAGQAAALNAGFKLAQGEVVCFIDSDDLWSPDKVEKMIAFMKLQPGGGVYQHQLDDGIGNLKKSMLISGDVYAEWIKNKEVNILTQKELVGIFLPTTGLVMRKEVLDRVFPIPEQLISCPDAYLSRVSCCHGPLHSFSGVLGTWRDHGENAGTGNFTFRKYWLPVVLPTINQYFEDNGIPVKFVHDE